MAEAALTREWVETIAVESKYYGLIISQVFESIAHERNLLRYYVLGRNLLRYYMLGKGTNVMDAKDKLSSFVFFFGRWL